MEKKEISATHKFEKEPLQANQYTISHDQGGFLIDFRNMFPQFSPDGEPIFVLNHRTVTLDPPFLKQFIESLKDNIKKYEDKFGEIKEKEVVPEAKKPETITKSESLGYVG